MKLPVTHIVASLLLTQSVQAAGVGQQHTTRGHTPSTSSPSHNGASPRLFPLLTKLRDATVEIFFGRHPTKAAAQKTPKSKDVRKQYTNELVLRFNVSTSDEEAALSDAAARLFLDIWAFTDQFVDIRLHADDVVPLLSLLPKSLQSAQSTLIPDLAAAVYQSLPSQSGRTATEPDAADWVLPQTDGAGDNLFFQDYQPLPVIIRWMKLLEAMFPSYVKYMAIGTSFEGKEIPGLRVGVPGLSDPDAPRKTIVVTGGLHAREWISTSTVNYLAWAFITSFGKEPMITKFLDEYNVIFIPAVNPDGIEYTWNVDRLWRKTRQPTRLRFCRGVDLDHAFGHGWGSSTMQHDPCSESYGGEEPFQAVEAQQLASWARNQTLHNHVRFVGLIDLHSYSQQVLFPYTYSCAVEPPNLENLEELAAGISKAIRIANGQSYSVTSACSGAVTVDGVTREEAWPRIESGGGSAIDWFYHEMRAHFSYQVKLRDTGSYGFLLPKEHIIPTGEELFNAMKYYGDYLLGNNGIEGVSMSDEEEVTEGFDFEDEEDELATSQELRRRRLRR